MVQNLESSGLSVRVEMRFHEVSKTLGGLPSWWAQLDSPGTVLMVGGWIRPRGK